MDHIQDQDLVKLKELLRHTGEFIAYFELAENKMTEWRHDIEEEAQHQQKRAQQQLQNMHLEIEALQEVLTQAGLARFRLTAEKALNQGEQHLSSLQKASLEFMDKISSKEAQLTQLIEQSLNQIEKHSSDAIARLNNQLMQYDVHHVRRIANESCGLVERVANNTLSKSERLLRAFHWRSISLALATTLISVFTIGLYLSNELPWEIHKQARNEREAGKVLMKAWPALSQEEKAKILNGRSDQDV